jgi:hypothetical protein
VTFIFRFMIKELTHVVTFVAHWAQISDLSLLFLNARSRECNVKDFKYKVRKCFKNSVPALREINCVYITRSAAKRCLWKQSLLFSKTIGNACGEMLRS